MIQTIINQIITYADGVAVAGVLAVAGYASNKFTPLFAKILESTKNEAITKLGSTQYNFYKGIALDIYYRVEEDFSGQKNVATQKIAAFDKYLTERIPSLTEQDLNHFRQTVVGTANTVLNQSTLLDSATATTIVNTAQSISQPVQTTDDPDNSTVAAVTQLATPAQTVDQPIQDTAVQSAVTTNPVQTATTVPNNLTNDEINTLNNIVQKLQTATPAVQ